MKRNLIFIMSCVAGLTFATNSYAQRTDLLKDQNPNHQESRAKYMVLTDSLTRNQGTTVQNTYKAYDWYEAREERRKLRRERNYQLNLNSGYYYNSPYFYPSISYGNYGYGSRFGYGINIGYGWGNNWGW